MEVLEVYELSSDYARSCEVVYRFRGTNSNYAGINSVEGAMEAIAALHDGLGWIDTSRSVIGLLLYTYTSQTHPELFV